MLFQTRNGAKCLGVNYSGKFFQRECKFSFILKGSHCLVSKIKPLSSDLLRDIVQQKSHLNDSFDCNSHVIFPGGANCT